MDDKKYWHELTAKEFDKIKDKSWSYIQKNYQQPDWCEYINALEGIMGCWSLVFLITGRKEHKKISRKFCKSCDCMKKESSK